MRSAGRSVLAVAGALTAAALAAGCTSATPGHAPHDVRPAAVPGSPATTASEPSSSPPPARPTPPVRTPCDHNVQRKLVFVDLEQQHMWMCDQHRVAGETAITSGMVGQYTHTPTGRYRIQGLNRDSTLTLNTGATYPVKFWIPFDAPLFGFHDSAWQRFPYGSAKYKTNGSHGCVHMPLHAIRFLYDWADVGTPVRIQA